MKLIIAEKGSLAESIATAIPGSRQQLEAGVVQKGDYIITHVQGHLLTLKMPEDYDPNLKRWEMDALPIYFDNWEKKVRPDGTDKDGKPKGKSPAKLLETVKKYLDEADEVIHAGDPDDEGQYLIDEVLEYLRYQGPVRRMNTADTTPAKLWDALLHADDNRNHIKSGLAAYARSVADLIVGVNLSRYFSLQNPEVVITIGRVQTPTLGLVVKRDLQIEGHKQITYYTVVGTADVDGTVIPIRYVPNPEDQNLTDGRILERAYAERLAGLIRGYPPLDGTVTAKDTKEGPPLPFNKTELSLYAERHWGYTPDQTLDITQSLRDKYNAITYNRTDCQYLTSAQYQEAPDVLAHVCKNINFRPKRMDESIKSKAFDDGLIAGFGGEAHTAIIPQAVDVDLHALTEPERNIYLAICKYYIAQFMPLAQMRKFKLTAQVPCGGSLQSTATLVISPGWRTIFREEEPPETSPLTGLSVGQHKVKPLNTEVTEGHTNPPPRFTQASLEKAMSVISKYVEDPKIKAMLLEKDKAKTDENGSIGTVATRADIIKGLLERQYLEPVGKGSAIRSTALGREMCSILPKELTEPELTAVWWTVQEDIKAGKASPPDLTGMVLGFVEHCLDTDYPKIDLSVVPDRYKRQSWSRREPLGTCPACGKPVIEGKMGFGCSGYKEGCKFVIWKTSKRPMFAGITFTASDAKKFLAGQRVVKRGLRKKDGGTFDAYLCMTYDPNNHYGWANIDPDFSEWPPKEGQGKKKGKSASPRKGRKRK